MKRGRTWVDRLHFVAMLILGLASPLCLTVFPIQAQEVMEWELPPRPPDRSPLTQQEVDHILREHRAGKTADFSGANLSFANLSEARLDHAILREAYLYGTNLSGAYLLQTDLSKAKLYNANLSGANLIGANLSEALLTKANLSKATLHQANLSNSYLFRADLRGADLVEANLNRAILSESNLSGAGLRKANLSGARLRKANLSGAGLTEANLSEAMLREANLSGAFLEKAILVRANIVQAEIAGATFVDADLENATLELKAGSITDTTKFVGVKGLPYLTYKNSPHSLMELREAFKKAGMRNQEREVTFALNHTRRLILWEDGKREWAVAKILDSLFNLVCFEWTCGYGMSPGRPLQFLGLGLLVFTIPYMLGLGSRNRETGIWVVLMPDRVLHKDIKDHPVKLTFQNPFLPPAERRGSRLRPTIQRLLGVLWVGFHFSLLSAFSLGWRELNVSNWITRIQKREYTLRATGWPRMVAGLQSLLSVYMLALWVLTYFGRPFD